MKITNKTITNQLNGNFRKYALYTLESRGIPNFYDSFTNVQRIILLNAPTSFQKTMSLVGNCIASNYHHGDGSLSKAIARVARPYGCSVSLLEGKGFFGTIVSQQPAAPRYTEIKINSSIKQKLSQLEFLNEIPKDDIPTRSHTYFPFGLLTGINGIAIGYKAYVLPRKLEDVEYFLEHGKILKNSISKKYIPPYFKNFTGTIELFKELANKKPVWKISGSVSESYDTRTILISDIPHVMNYKSYTESLAKIVDQFDTIDVINSSKDTINITLKFSKATQEEFFNEIVEKVKKITSVLVTENPVFIKDSRVLNYATIEDYLLDFKDDCNYTRKKELQFKEHANVFEKHFLNEKILYIEFMLQKKRTRDEVSEYLSNVKEKYPMYDTMYSKLYSIAGHLFTKDEIAECTQKIALLNKEIQEINKQLEEVDRIIEKLPSSFRTLSIAYSKELLEEMEGLELFTEEDEVENFEVDEVE